MGIWRYRLEDDFVLKHDALLGVVRFESEWVLIKDGTMWVKKGYAWDGCTPAYPLCFLGLWVGIWDGPLGTDCRPVTWKASLCHDVLCQYRKYIYGVSKDDSVRLFRELLWLNHAPKWMCALYPAAVSKYGPQAWLGN